MSLSATRSPEYPSLAVEQEAESASKGDATALGTLYERYADPVLRYMLTRTCNDVPLAEDLAGETWERVARSIRRYEPQGGGFVAWLFTIARRTVTTHYRSMFKKGRLDGAMLAGTVTVSEAPDEAYARHLLATQVAAAVQKLPTSQRECVILRFYSNLSLADTAAVMGKKPNAIKQLQFRGLRALQQQLGDLAPQPRAEPVVTLAADAHSEQVTR
jgi:RNA polymerase sigma-70 factor (ECF subfamily)